MDYKKICFNLLKSLPQRTSNVIERRFGLKTGDPETLEAIGASYGITRERVRQIETEGMSKIKLALKKNKHLINSLEKSLVSFGGIKEENNFLSVLGGEKYKNCVLLLLSGLDNFKRSLGDNNFYAYWTINSKIETEAKKIVKSAVSKLNREKKTLNLKDLLESQKINKTIFASYIDLSKNIKKSPEGKYGLSHWMEIRPRGIKDKAYLVFKKENQPVHFAEVANLIEKLPFSKGKVHVATVHNELIKDNRFVLVGRGLYALKEWGYEPGATKDIIVKTIKDSGKSLSKEEILAKVKEQRFVKENTIVFNLQNKNYFLRDSQGRYTIKEA